MRRGPSEVLTAALSRETQARSAAAAPDVFGRRKCCSTFGGWLDSRLGAVRSIDQRRLLQSGTDGNHSAAALELIPRRPSGRRFFWRDCPRTGTVPRSDCWDRHPAGASPCVGQLLLCSNRPSIPPATTTTW